MTPDTKTGFSAITTDSFGYAIGESGDVELEGVTEPTTINPVTFSFDDTSSVGQYSTFRIGMTIGTSIG